jgi:hypothetical protein
MHQQKIVAGSREPCQAIDLSPLILHILWSLRVVQDKDLLEINLRHVYDDSVNSRLHAQMLVS